MSNYRYLRDIIEKIAEKGNIPKEDIPETLHFARMDSNRIKDVDEYVNNRLQKDYNKDKDLKTYLEEEAFSREEARDIADTEDVERSYFPYSMVHNKYSKYLPVRSRIREREEILENLYRYYAKNPRVPPTIKQEKRELYDALLEKLRQHPLYDERNNIDTYY